MSTVDDSGLNFHHHVRVTGTLDDDGTGEIQIFIPASTGVNPFDIPWVTVGNSIRVTGCSARFLGQYEVLPRLRGDIHPVNWLDCRVEC